MAYQRGSLKKVSRKEGATWVLRFRVSNADGRRVENTLPVGLVRDFPKAQDAWREVDRLGILARVNSDAPCPGRTRFDSLAEHYLKADFGEDAVRPKLVNTIPIVEHYVRDYLIARWGGEIADDIKPLDLQRWLKSLHTEKKLAWTTIAKIRSIMLRIYKGRHPARARYEESGAARRDALEDQLQGHRHEPTADAGHHQGPALHPALDAGADLCGDRAARIRDTLFALGGHSLE
jgi:hypothetical protein